MKWCCWKSTLVKLIKLLSFKEAVLNLFFTCTKSHNLLSFHSISSRPSVKCQTQTWYSLDLQPLNWGLNSGTLEFQPPYLDPLGPGIRDRWFVLSKVDFWWTGFELANCFQQSGSLTSSSSVGPFPGAEAVATFLLRVFVYMTVDAMNRRRSGVYLANAWLHVTSCSGFSQSAQSKPQDPSRSFSGSI